MQNDGAAYFLRGGSVVGTESKSGIGGAGLGETRDMLGLDHHDLKVLVKVGQY